MTDGAGRLPPAPPGTVYFEFTALGNSMRVAAVDAVTGTEVVVIGPVQAHRRDLEQLALRKLQRQLRQS